MFATFTPGLQPGFAPGPMMMGNPAARMMMMAQMSQMLQMMQMMMGQMQTMGGANYGPMAMNNAFGQMLGMPGQCPCASPWGMPPGGYSPYGPGNGYSPNVPFGGPYGGMNGVPPWPSAPPGMDPMGQMGGAQYNGPINVENVIRAIPPAKQNAARQHFPIILNECQRQRVTDRAQIAYILATAVHESNAGGAMEEFASGRAYEGRRDLGNTCAGDGMRFKGRGYVQITGRRNYQQWSQRLGVDLVGNPALAQNPQIAARILVGGMRDGTFTGRQLDDYVGNGRCDFTNARRCINGTDRAGSIAQIAQRIMMAM